MQEQLLRMFVSCINIFWVSQKVFEDSAYGLMFKLHPLARQMLMHKKKKKNMIHIKSVDFKNEHKLIKSSVS